MEINGVNKVNNNLEQLSSNKRINSASDDISVSQISESVNSDIESNSVYISNSLDSFNYINTTNSILDNINKDAIRIKELTIQSDNSIYKTSDKEAFQNEINKIKENINSSINNSEFNDNPIFQGFKSQISNNNFIEISPSINNLSNIDIDNPETIKQFDEFLKNIQIEKSELSAKANFIDTHIENLINNKNINESSKINIEDSDYTKTIIDRSIKEIQDNINLNIQNIKDVQKGNIIDLLI